MTLNEVMKELKSYGNETTKRTLLNHGAIGPLFGVRVQDLKKIVKKVKKNHELSIELFDTGNSDAMYLAGLIADEDKITKGQLKKWVKNAGWQMISEYTVPWVTAESRYAEELADEWINSKKELIASAGWSTWASIVAYKPDPELDIKHLQNLIARVEKEIHKSENRVRYAMNNFIISVGGYVKELNSRAMSAANKIGEVEVDMAGTSCKVPLAETYIKKMMARNNFGRKRKTTRC